MSLVHNAIMGLATLTVGVGCAGTLNDAAIAGRQHGALIDAKKAPPSERCVSLDNQAAGWGATGKIAASLAGAEGLVAIPIEDKTGRGLVIAGAVATGALAVGALYLADKRTEAWARECAAEVSR